jgi:putative membrane protein
VSDSGLKKQAACAEDWHRVSPVSLVFYLFRFVRQFVVQGLPGLIVLFASAASSEKFRLSWAVAAVVVLLILLAVIALLSYLRFRYRICADRVVVRRGILHREELNIDFDRVQNINIKELFYMRPFGLSVMGIDTAGSQGKEIDIAGIPVALAREYRNAILDRRNPAGPRGSNESDMEQGGAQVAGPVGQDSIPQGTERLLLELDNRDVALYGLTTNFLLWIAIAFGAFFGAGDYAEKTLGTLSDRLGLSGAVSSMVMAGDFLGLFLWGLAIFLSVVVILPLLSVLGAFFRYHDYRLTVDGSNYRYESGLLTRHQGSVKQQKIQAVVWRQNAMGRLLGRINLQLRQASAGTGLESGELSGILKTMFVVPSLLPSQADSLSAEFLPDLQAGDVKWSRVNRRRFVRLGIAGFTLPATLVLMTPAILVSPLFLLPVPLMAAALYPIFVQLWKRIAYGVVGAYGFVRTGFIGSTVTVFPLYKIQRIDFRQTPWQRRAGFAHLKIHLASHSLNLPYVPVEDARRLQDLALYEVESSTLAWF